MFFGAGIGYMRTVCELVAQLDVDFGVNDDLLDTDNTDDLCRAVRVARVIDQTAGSFVNWDIPHLVQAQLTRDCLSSLHRPPVHHRRETDTSYQCPGAHTPFRVSPQLERGSAHQHTR